MNKQTIVVYGATSAIVHELSKLFATNGNADFILFGRNEQRLESCAKDLLARGATTVHTEHVDFLDINSLQQSVARAYCISKNIELVVLGQGSLTNQEKAEYDVHYANDEMFLNFQSFATPILGFIETFRKVGKGGIIAFSSVAGDRGRKSNYVYGTAKAALSAFMSGLRNEFSKTNIHVLTVKPGIVDSPMTAAIPKNILFAKPDKIAQDVFKAYKNKVDVLYTPFFWKYIMLIIKTIPESIFKKMSL